MEGEKMARGASREHLTAAAQTIRVFVTDTNTIFREGLRTVIAQDEGLSVVGHGSDNMSATLESVADTRPDVVLLGLERITGDTESVVADILRAVPLAEVIVLGWDVETDALRQLMAQGVRAYLPKDVPHRYLLSTIYMSTFEDSRIVFSWPRPTPEKRSPPAAVSSPPTALSSPPAALSSREREVVELVGKALTNAQIGRQLSISEGTVKRHLHNIFVKLHAVSRLDAVNKAIDLSLIMLD
ncbi:DNA-binding response regulator [Streptomyces albiflavescens]|uniref:DNA-binding response regulator n=1 Tax=Streptomyces albiflavescens TaxID=1623582 RepID=A0A917Y7Z4_9ACTN|nr:response regulator transcription factor [Streptomyces albiflavescens]GGN74362.1 DNA-binding response regulator [Streptomyces albiflavescens]